LITPVEKNKTKLNTQYSNGEEQNKSTQAIFDLSDTKLCFTIICKI